MAERMSLEVHITEETNAKSSKRKINSGALATADTRDKASPLPSEKTSTLPIYLCVPNDKTSLHC